MFDWLSPEKWVPAVILQWANVWVNGYAGLVQQVIQLLFAVAVPKPDDLLKSWFSLGIGATYGVAPQVLTAVYVVVGLIVLLRPTGDHRKKISKSIISLVLLSAFGVLFMPVYSLLYELSRSLVQGILNLATSSPNGTTDMLGALLKVAFPDDPLSKLVTTGVGYVFAFFTLIEAVMIFVVLILAFVTYPIAIALLPLGNEGVKAFADLLLTMVVTGLLAPPLMGLGFVLPIVVKGYVPGGSLSFVQAGLAVVGGVFAAGMPLLVAYLAHSRASAIHGRVAAMLENHVDVRTMPPLSINDARQSLDETHRGLIGQKVLPLVTEIANFADLKDDETLFGSPSQRAQTALKAASIGASVFGQPEIAAAASAGASYFGSRHEKNKASKEPATEEVS